MPKITSHAKILRDWEGLLGAVNANASLLPGVDDLQASLEKLLADGQAAKTQQAFLTSNKQSVTQNVNQILADGAEAARMLRGFVLSHLGSKSELVKQFGLPIRNTKKKPKPATPPPPTTAPTPETPETPTTAKPVTPTPVTPTTATPAAGGTSQTGTPQTPQAADKADPGAASESHRTVK
jgi:outer membrane biosynthesis protein TonB